ncbi:MAG: DsbA family protein [Xanthomonadaceae bacterium]|nr:DsbA family protein [Xanthomonadaceae bacterium]
MNKKLTLKTLATLIILSIATACTNSTAKPQPNFVFKNPEKPNVLAKIGGKEISEEVLVGDDKLAYMDIKKKEYEFKIGQLKKLLVERLIGEEAKKAGMSLQDYIKKNVLKGEIKISDSEFKKFVADKKIPEGQINDQLKQRIMGFLKEQKNDELIDAYIAKITKSNPVEVFFSKPKMSIEVAVGDSVSWGNKDAKVSIVEFSDFQCPFCSRGANSVDEIKKKYKGKVKIAFKHFPLPMHPDAKPASEAALCVNAEGGADKFWKYHDLLFKNQDKLDSASLEKYAKDLGIKEAKFKECVASKKFAAAVEADMQYGEKIGVRSTPTFFINGQLISGAVPIEQFSEVIDEALKN